MIAQSAFHRWRHAQGLKNLAEVVVREMQRDGVFVFFDFLAKAIRQARETAQVHPHRQVLTFHERSRKGIILVRGWQSREKRFQDFEGVPRGQDLVVYTSHEPLLFDGISIELHEGIGQCLDAIKAAGEIVCG